MLNPVIDAVFSVHQDRLDLVDDRLITSLLMTIVRPLPVIYIAGSVK